MIESTKNEATTDVLLKKAMALRARCLTRKRELAGISSRWFTGSDRVLYDEAEGLIGELIEELKVARRQRVLTIATRDGLYRQRDELSQQVKELSMERDLWRELAQDAVRDANAGRQQIVESLKGDERCEVCCYLADDCECEPETKGEAE